MECKAEPTHVMNLTDVSIDLTRMECKGITRGRWCDWDECIDLTRMECKAEQMMNYFPVSKLYRFNQNGM